MMLKAVAPTLADEPEFNAHWTEAGHEVIDDINIGVAIDIPAGLIARAIVDCRDLDVGGVFCSTQGPGRSRQARQTARRRTE